jgi:predicted deacetylase
MWLHNQQSLGSTHMLLVYAYWRVQATQDARHVMPAQQLYIYMVVHNFLMLSSLHVIRYIILSVTGSYRAVTAYTGHASTY